MAVPTSVATTVSAKGTPEGVLLKRAPASAATRPEEVYGSLPHRGAPRSLEAMDAAVMAEARRRRDRL